MHVVISAPRWRRYLRNARRLRIIDSLEAKAPVIVRDALEMKLRWVSYSDVLVPRLCTTIALILIYISTCIVCLMVKRYWTFVNMNLEIWIQSAKHNLFTEPILFYTFSCRYPMFYKIYRAGMITKESAFHKADRSHATARPDRTPRK